MLSRVLRTIRRHRLIGEPETGVGRLLCAVSGGPDSMALLACMWELRSRLNLTLEVATVDHGLRPEAAAEAAMVAERAAALGLPWHLLRVDVAAARASNRPQTSKASKTSARGGVQEVARRLRLTALENLAILRGLDRVALGHQADDQTETVLFRILRGTGLVGLAGIPYHRQPFIRPLLDVTRAEIDVYLHDRSIPFVVDPSNADRRYARARLRADILPLLRRENPRVDQALRRLGSLAAAVTHHQSLDGLVPAGPAGTRGHIPSNVPTRVAIQVQAAAQEGNGTRSFDIPGGKSIVVSYGQIVVEGRRQTRRPPKTESRPVAGRAATLIPGPGSYPVGNGRVLVAREESTPPSVPSLWKEDRAGGLQEACFDADQLLWPLVVRALRPGDRLRPRGGRGSRKLSDMLIDAKIPRRDRADLPIVAGADGGLLFVPGLRSSCTAEPSAVTRRWITLAVTAISAHDALVDRSIVRSNTQTQRYSRRLPKGAD